MTTEHISVEQFQNLFKKTGGNRSNLRAKGKTHIQGRMNGTEAKYAQFLQEQKIAGEITLFKFESIKLRLADKTYYTPDFMVLDREGIITFHEVKGFWQDDARVKIKVAAEQFPEFGFVAVQLKGGVWNFEKF